MSFELFIFDFDGTLADSGPANLEIYNAMAPTLRLRTVTREEAEALREVGTREALKRLGIPLWRLPHVSNRLRRRAAEGDPPPLFPGVAATLADLARAGRRLAVVSSNGEALIRRALGPELAAQFEAFACNASMFGKAPLLRRVLRRTGIDPAHAIYVGDETRDADAARRAKIAFGAVDWGYATAQALAAKRPDFSFKAPSDILSVTPAGRA